jgi:uncharacterized protein DUF6660
MSGNHEPPHLTVLPDKVIFTFLRFLVVLRPMRIFASILAVYLLAMAMLPCGDAAGSAVERGSELLGMAYSSPSSHGPHTDNCGDDFCSPLCGCNCCQILTTSAKKSFLPKHILLPAPQNLNPFEPAFTGFLHLSDIWQPPKMG